MKKEPVMFIDQYQRGEFAALQQIYREYFLHLYFYSKNLISDPQYAEKIATQVLGILWQKKEKFPSMQAMKAFLVITTRNKSLGFLAYKRDYKKLPEYAPPTESVGESLVKIYEKIESIPKELMKVLEKLYSGKSVEEAAEELQISITEIEKSKEKALAFLPPLFSK